MLYYVWTTIQCFPWQTLSRAGTFIAFSAQRKVFWCRILTSGISRALSCRTYGRFFRGTLSQALRATAVWTFYCAYSKRPKDERKTAQGFSPGKVRRLALPKQDRIMLPAGLDILGRPKGENRIAHGLQPWEDGPERNQRVRTRDKPRPPRCRAVVNSTDLPV